jgi:ribosomal-protein-alanine N-acetyltransferase
MGSVDVDMGRVWWFGPFIEGEEDAGEWVVKADALYGAASSMLPDGVDQEEIAVDARFDLLLDWAPTLGFGRDPGSAVLTLDHAIDPSTLATRQIVPSDSATVGALHDQLFPGTHTTGDALVVGRDDTHVGLVAESDGAVVGYIAVERQPDGDGYIDYLGVEPAHRRRGAGEQLVRAGVTALAELDCRRVSLTVREDNAGARALYRGLGFVEERVLVPLRKGFSIP